ncbi:MAG: hypothetical protein V9E93_04340 [Steroidobacteraceae bacterium]|jgi:hypothetical protein
MIVEVYDFRSDDVGGVARERLEARREHCLADDRWVERALA